MLMVHYISNVINVYKRNFDVFYCKKVEIRPQTYVNFLKAFQSMTLYGTPLQAYSGVIFIIFPEFGPPLFSPLL